MHFCLLVQLRIRDDRRRGDGMVTYHFLHPDHIVPAAELVAALVKAANQAVAQVLMEANAVVVQVRISADWRGNAGVQVQEALLF